MDEIWKSVPITGYEHLYEVSSLGQVRRIRDGHLMKGYYQSHGYLYVALYNRGVSTRPKIHSLVAKAFLVSNPYIQFGNSGKDLTVNHKNFIKTDNRLENLEIISREENTKHGWAFNPPDFSGINQGSKHGMAKLTEDDIPFIRTWYAEGIGYKRTALRLYQERSVKVGWQMIAHIIKGRSWTHVP